MIYVLSGVLARIVSNSALNVFQKILTSGGTKPSSVNFFTYLGLSLISLLLLPFINIFFSAELTINFVLMGILGALGNYFIIKALSVGELSSLAPINSYKPVVALIIAFLYLKEIPSIYALLGIVLIIAGTYILYGKGECNKKALFFRILALVFSASEAVFIKKIIILTDVPTSFALWAFAGLIFSSFFLLPSKSKLKLPSSKYMFYLVISVAIMEYSTNYVFSKMNVSYALALFQLSTILSVFLGVNIFKEKGLKRKITASLIMIFGAAVIIIFS
ncbi:EamA family transporter [bacterium]|nr:EamA family transporter [bacterium]